VPRNSRRNGSSASIEALVAAIRAVADTTTEDAKPRHRRRTSADVRASWAPTDRIVFEPEREAITGFARQWWYSLEKKGRVPKRIKLGDRRVGWKLSELEAWLEACAALREAGGDDARPAA
jgi:prophage regulatory protein